MYSFFERIERLSDAESIALNERFGTHNYHPLPVNIVRANGPYAYDGSGKQFIDCVGSYSAVATGHLHERILGAVRIQMEKLTLTSRAVYTSELGVFLEDLCRYTQMDMACPMNTGAEAIETAIKLARKWAYTVKGIPANQAEIIVADENFHGRTVTIVGFSSEEAYKANFGPFTPGFKSVPFGDLAALEATITPNTAAILMEPIQAEAGILFPPDGYLAAVRRLCDAHNVLLIWDEIQTGFCRTGKPFAWEHEDAKPDLVCLGKALGGAVYPVSAVAGRFEAMKVFKPGDHGSTFGGNPLAAIIGLASIETLEALKLDENSAKQGAKLKAAFESMDHPVIMEVRGRGLLVGVEVKEGTDTEKLTAAFLSEGVLTKETRHRTYRFAPPLIVDDALIGEIVSRTKRALDSVIPVGV
jgi:ornithine--oxo-acid transaminase